MGYLALSDSLSYRQAVLEAPAVIGDMVRSSSWFPRAQVWNLAVCYPTHRLAELPGFHSQQQVQQLAQGLAAEINTPQKQNSMILPVLAECHSALIVASAIETRNALTTGTKDLNKGDSEFMERVVPFCQNALKMCGYKLARNVLKVTNEKDYWPSFLPEVEQIDLKA